MSDIKNIPYVELVERVRSLAREKAKNDTIVRSVINTVYTKDIPREHDWVFLKSDTAVVCIAEYNTGTVSVNTQGTVCTFYDGIAITSQMTGRKIKFNGNSNVYEFTYTAANSGSINPPLSGSINVNSGSYTIYKDIYALPEDFDRFPINGGLLFYQSGQPQPIPEKEDDDYYEEATATPSSVIDSCRLYGMDSAGNWEVQLIPPPKTPLVLNCEYLKALNPMKFTTAGTVSVNSGATAVLGAATLFTQATTGDYFRVDANGTNEDSRWHRITAISDNTGMTISPAFKGDANAASETYTICSAPDYPYRLQDAIIYGSMRQILVDQNDKNFVLYESQYKNSVGANKVLYKNRKAKDDLDLIASDYEYRR